VPFDAALVALPVGSGGRRPGGGAGGKRGTQGLVQQAGCCCVPAASLRLFRRESDSVPHLQPPPCI
jgi:hypothetical protein